MKNFIARQVEVCSDFPKDCVESSELERVVCRHFQRGNEVALRVFHRTKTRHEQTVTARCEAERFRRNGIRLHPSHCAAT